ncbi:SIMPL domain-containing protein [Schleiferiaceae bacterium]|nr:SIMPL domain-containing protein [Schleiferiaceae bacterium]MDC1225605.1 SIMPL domain-containing protein [Schleiferiaceae bacterium]MDC1493328.1 SIMPL domain-containing protein [Schleiferiaceae bacterium]
MKRTVAAIFAVSILGAAMFLAHAYKTRGDQAGNISVTGLGEVDFESDQVIWSGRFEASSVDLGEAFAKIKAQRSKVENYLVEKGVSKDEIQFEQVSTYEREKSVYNDQGKYVGSEFDKFELNQRVVVNSEDLDLVSSVSREISELLNEGVQITSEKPDYYYSKLDELKLDLIEKASENGRIRAEQIAKNSKSDLKGLKSARLGVFQILGYNSGESYSWSGTFNTSSRWKTASITVKMDFEVE